MSVVGDVLIDGVRTSPGDASISIFDIGFQRGYGCFETMRSYAGYPFRLKQHLDRLESSAAMLRMPLPPRSSLEEWSLDRAGEGDVAIKILVTGGRNAAAPGDGSATVVYAEQIPDLPSPVRLLPLAAPWHPDGRRSELTGAKTLSYAPNIASRLVAVDAGFDDAVLIGPSGHVLEGPTYGIGWIRGDEFVYPAPELGVLASVTANAVLDIVPDAGLRPRPGLYPLEDMLAADEVVVMSTLSEVRPVGAIGEVTMATGAGTTALAAAFSALVAREQRG